MKKTLVLLAAGLVLAGCGGESATETSTTAVTSSVVTQTTTKTTTTTPVIETTEEATPTAEVTEEPQGIAVTGEGGSCGTVSSALYPGMNGKEVRVASGQVDCVEAFEIMNTYANTEASGDGNINVQTFGDWTCMAPTAVRSAEIGMGVYCDKSTGERIFLPN